MCHTTSDIPEGLYVFKSEQVIYRTLQQMHYSPLMLNCNTDCVWRADLLHIKLELT